jgi:hypothetical protein
MARVLIGTWMVRYPLGGNLSWSIQWLVGFRRLGHDVYVIEKSGYPNSCFDPLRGAMDDDCTYGTRVVGELLNRFGLADRWCYVDARGIYYGMAEVQVRELFRTADVFLDLGTHGAWLEEASAGRARTVLVDGEPGFTQMKMEAKLREGKELPRYDYYYTNGANVGTQRCDSPTAGLSWRHVFNPVVLDLIHLPPPPPAAPFTTVMNWQAHDPIRYRGREFGQKDVELARFIDLPRRTSVPLEIAVAKKCPEQELLRHGWRLRQAHEVTISYDSYWDYICASRGEFSVCKNVFVATRNGWFSDRSAAYLAGGRPVVVQETGFSDVLPTGRGLLAVRTADEAASALEAIVGDFDRHSDWAREIAAEYLDTNRVVPRLLAEIGCG